MLTSTTLNFIRITEVKNLIKKNYCDNVEKVETPHFWWDLKLVSLLWKYAWRILKKVKIDLPHDPARPFLGI